MADISNELQAIMDAVYGEEVRGSIHDALEKMNENAEAAEAWATGGSGGTAGAQNNAKYYSEQAAQSASTFEVDDTLSIEGKAADAAAVGGVSNRSVKFMRNLTAEDTLSELDDIGVYIATSEAIATALYNSGFSPTKMRFVLALLGKTVGNTTASAKMAIIVNSEHSVWVNYKQYTAGSWGNWTRLANYDSVTDVSATVDKIANDFQDVVGGLSIDINDGVAIAGYISGDGGILSEDTGVTSMRQFSTGGKWKTLYITAKETQSAVVALLNEPLDELEYGDPVSFATGETGIHSIPAGQSETIEIPDDCSYVSILRARRSIIRVPEAISVMTNANLIGSMDELSKKVEGTIETYSASSYTAYVGYINSDNVWSSASSTRHSVIPMGDAKVVKITANSNRDAVIAFLKTYDFVAGAVPDFADGETGRRVIKKAQSATILVPVDAEYLYFARGNPSDNIPAEMIGYCVALSPDILSAIVSAAVATVDVNNRDNVRDIPKNQGVRNCYKKVHQFLDVPFSVRAPIVSIPDMQEGDYTGTLYSGTADKAHYVGFNVSFRSYVTAMHNPYSGMYTEYVKEYDSSGKGDISAYDNVTYHGTNARTPIGIVCAPLVTFSLGMPIKWENHAFPYLESIGVMERVLDQSATGVELCDIIYERGHVAIVTDIYRDSRGVPTSIFVSENGYHLGSTTEYTAAHFTNHIKNNRVLYRYRDLERNLSYRKNEFVAVDGESEPEPYVFNEDICPYLGDYSVYNEGDLIAICYTKGTYSNMVISKGDAVAVTVQLPIDDNAHQVDLRPWNLTEGHYSARLTGSSGNSDPCYFDVLNLPISVSENGDNITVTFDSTKDPRYIQVCNIAGASRCVVELTDTDKEAGEKTFNIREQVAAQMSTVTGTDCYVEMNYGVTDPAGYDLIRASSLIPLNWTE